MLPPILPLLNKSSKEGSASGLFEGVQKMDGRRAFVTKFGFRVLAL